MTFKPKNTVDNTVVLSVLFHKDYCDPNSQAASEMFSPPTHRNFNKKRNRGDITLYKSRHGKQQTIKNPQHNHDMNAHAHIHGIPTLWRWEGSH